MSIKNLTERLWAKDPSLWPTTVQHKIQNRLGWLTAPWQFLPRSAEITNWANQVVEDGFRFVVLLGMGGSSLAPDVFTQTFRSSKSLLLIVLDTTDPASILSLEERIDLKKYGPLIENHEIFPEKCNVTIAKIINKNLIKVKVWERGAAVSYTHLTLPTNREV